MKKIRQILICVILTGACYSLHAQDTFSGLIKSSPADATKLVNAFALPLFKGLGADQNGGWANTAKTKKKFQFDIRISAAASFITSADKTFDVTKLGLSNHVKPDDPAKIIAPTFGGTKTAGPLLNIYDDDGQKVGSFNTPAGVVSVIPMPQLQATIGLPLNNDLIIRAIPTVNAGNSVGKISMLGFGIKHNIMPDIAGKIVPFDLAVAFAYSHLNLNKSLSVHPDADTPPQDSLQNGDFTHQRLVGNFNSLMAQLIISKKVRSFTPFAAIGYNSTRANVVAIGNYPVTTEDSYMDKSYTTFTNPVSIKETVIKGARADIGFQLNIGFFCIYASYSLAQYSSVNGGIGFGI